MKFFLLGLSFFLFLKLHAQKYQKNGKADSLYVIVDVPPSFPGGDEEMYRYLEEKIYLSLPEAYAQRFREEGRYSCIVTFVVDRYGHVSGASLDSRSRDFYLSDLLTSIFNHMPQWEAGVKNEHEVNTLVYLPLDISLEGEYPAINYHPLYPDSELLARKRMSKKQKRWAIVAAVLFTGLLAFFASRGFP